jgi:dinuclear metal center YbgI/SA1388 family protein
MNTIKDIIDCLSNWAPLSLQESYDNAGLIVGNPHSEVSKVLVTLDATEAVIDEAIQKKCNLVIAHHPIVFKGLTKINGSNYVERVIIKAIKNDIAIYAIHTNLDNMLTGVNNKIAKVLGLQNLSILEPKTHTLGKLITYVPSAHQAIVKEALFKVGAGKIGNYDRCSFSVQGAGTFRAGELGNPFVGKIGETHTETEDRVEVIYPLHIESQLVAALKQAHPYEEVPYELVAIRNVNPEIGSGMLGELPEEMSSASFLDWLKKTMELSIIRYTPFSGAIKKVALCGGAGSFLIKQAIRSGAQAFITADVKYHEFFDAEQSLMIADIGHYESEIFTKELISKQILDFFPTFAVLLSETNTNPIKYH